MIEQVFDNAIYYGQTSKHNQYDKRTEEIHSSISVENENIFSLAINEHYHQEQHDEYIHKIIREDRFINSNTLIIKHMRLPMYNYDT